jgi:hypothetical protein
MRNLQIFAAGAVIFFACLVCALADETITITTYYPSPYGSYSSLQIDKLGVGDNNGDGSLTSADIPTTTGYAWIKGRLGIGTINPVGKLEVNMGNNNNFFRVNDTENNIGVELRSGTTGGTPYIDFSNDPTTDYHARIIMTGTDYIAVQGANLGIGTTTPGAKLSFNNVDDGTNGADGITWYNPSPGDYGIYRTAGAWAANDYQQLMLKWSTGIIIDGGNNATYTKDGILMQPSGGTVNIGVAVGTYSGKLNVVGGPANSAIFAYGGTNPTASGVIQASWQYIVTPYYSYMGYRDGATNYGLYTNGYVYSPYAFQTSDIRFKKNIKELDNVLEKVMKLRGVKYEWRAEEYPDRGFNAGPQIGLIAQEIENEFPELTMTDPKGFKGVEYNKFAAVLLEAIKEQQREIEKLKKDISEIKEKRVVK